MDASEDLASEVTACEVGIYTQKIQSSSGFGEAVGRAGPG